MPNAPIPAPAAPPTAPTPGSVVYVWINQGWRQGKVLATLASETLLEYEMPNGTTALVFASASEVGASGADSPISGLAANPEAPHVKNLIDRRSDYRILPASWLRAVAEQAPKRTWAGRGQRGPVPSPDGILAERAAKRKGPANHSMRGWLKPKDGRWEKHINGHPCKITRVETGGLTGHVGRELVSSSRSHRMSDWNRVAGAVITAANERPTRIRVES